MNAASNVRESIGETFTGGTLVFVTAGVISEIALAQSSGGLRFRCLRLGQIGCDAGLGAALDVGTLPIPPVTHGGQVLGYQGLLGPLRHDVEWVFVAAIVRDFLLDDDVTGRINGTLQVISNCRRALT